MKHNQAYTFSPGRPQRQGTLLFQPCCICLIEHQHKLLPLLHQKGLLRMYCIYKTRFHSPRAITMESLSHSEKRSAMLS